MDCFSRLFWDPCQLELYNGMTPSQISLETQQPQQIRTTCLVAVGVWLEWSIDLDTDVIRLFLAQLCHASTEGRQVKSCHLLIQRLRQQVDIVLVCLSLLPVLEDVKLRQDLIGEGAGHHERRMSCGTAQIHKTARGKHNDTMAIWEYEAVHLRLDVLHLDAREVLEVLHGNLIVEVADVANDGIVLHLLHVLQRDDLEVASG